MKYLFSLVTCLVFVENLNAQDVSTIKKNVISVNLPLYSILDYERQIVNINNTNINGRAGVGAIALYRNFTPIFSFGVNAITWNYKSFHLETGLNYSLTGNDFIENLYGLVALRYQSPRKNPIILKLGGTYGYPYYEDQALLLPYASIGVAFGK